MSQSVHTYPTTDEHVTQGLGCWCVPRYYLPCDECDVELAPVEDATERIYERGEGCWKCTDGLIELTQAEAHASEHPLVIVHNR